MLASPQKMFCLQVHGRVKLLVVGFQGQKTILFELEDILIHLQFRIMLQFWLKGQNEQISNSNL